MSQNENNQMKRKISFNSDQRPSKLPKVIDSSSLVHCLEGCHLDLAVYFKYQYFVKPLDVLSALHTASSFTAVTSIRLPWLNAFCSMYLNDTMERLLNYCINLQDVTVTIDTKDGADLFWCCLTAHHLRGVKMLVARDSSIINKLYQIQECDKAKQITRTYRANPLSICLGNNFFLGLNYLVSQGADVNAPVHEHNRTSFMVAALNKNTQAMKILKEAENFDPDLKDDNGHNSLYYVKQAVADTGSKLQQLKELIKK